MQETMSEHVPKRIRLSVEEVLEEMDEVESEPMTQGSDDEFEDITCCQKERDDSDGIEHDPSVNPVESVVDSSQPSSPTPSPAPVPSTPPTPARQQRPRKGTSSAATSGWSTTLSPVDISPFTQPVGPTLTIPTGPGEVFNLFLTDEICSLITRQSNLYAQQVLGEKYGEWEKLTIEELRAFFGFMILMGLYPRPALSDYWRRDPFINYAPISERISRDRFFDICRFLHFADNSVLQPSGSAGYDRLGKVREVMDRVSVRFVALYQPHCENAIDEAMIPFQGRSCLKQYMPAKPVKRGIKVWCRCDSHNGYLCEFQVYTGKSEGVQVGLGQRVVLDLSQRLQGKHYHLYFDNFFSSVPLLSSLLEKGLYACGTARQTYREFPASLKMRGKSKAEMERHGLVNRGDSEILQKGGVTAILWRDNRVVKVLSTNSQPHQQDVVRRTQRDGTRAEVHCPAAIELYQKYMGGVDRNDQLRQYYRVRTKCRKFYRYIFWFLFEAAAANAYILHSNYSGASRQPLKEFRLALAKSLIGEYHTKKRHNRHTAPPTTLSFLHYPMKKQSDTTVRSRCWFCWHKRGQQRRDTLWYCHECQLHLCHTGIPTSDCFLQYHKQ